MTEKFDLYKCQVCGNTVQVLLPGDGELVCCSIPMTHLTPRTDENHELAEKHIPEIEMEDNGKFVRLKHHPMSEEHYIQFIEAYRQDKSCLHIKFLKPNEPAEFDISYLNKDKIEALEHCNIHGLWRSKND
jgi:superoxide reductase